MAITFQLRRSLPRAKEVTIHKDHFLETRPCPRCGVVALTYPSNEAKSKTIRMAYKGESLCRDCCDDKSFVYVKVSADSSELPTAVDPDGFDIGVQDAALAEIVQARCGEIHQMYQPVVAALGKSQEAMIAMTQELGMIEQSADCHGLPYGIKKPKILIDFAIMGNASALAAIKA